MRRTVVSIIFKSKCILCIRHYGQITIETPLYNFCYFKNLKYFLPLLAYCWTTPLCHRKGNIGGCHYNRVVKVCFSESLALVSCAEDPFGLKNDWNYSGWAYPNLQTFSSNNWIMQDCSKATSWWWGESSSKILVHFELFPKETCSSQKISACGRLRLLV